MPTAAAHNVLVPASRQSFLLPSADNTALNSPLQDGLTTDAIQGISFTAPQSWTPPLLTSYYLPVYPIARVPVTTTDVMTVTRELGVGDARDITMQADGGIAAHIQVDGAPYTLTVYAGYGTPRFTLHALASEPGTLSSVRLTAQASAWLQYHGALLHPDMRALPPSSGAITYSQTVSDTAILGPVALSLSFDGRGALRDLSYDYIVPNAPILAPAQSSIIAASTAILTYDGQALYSGPPPTTATGPAVVSGLTLAYVGVRDVKDDYLEPVYVLNGDVNVGAAGPQPFDLYISALAPPPVPASTTGP